MMGNWGFARLFKLLFVGNWERGRRNGRFRIVLLLLLLLQGLYGRETAVAQSCDVYINELLFDPTPGNPLEAEWVELYIAATVTTDLDLFITDQEAGFPFAKAFTVPGNTPAGTYILIHNDGDPANDQTFETIGIYAVYHYYIGSTTGRLHNDGDDVALYLGSDSSGTPCDYMQYKSSVTGPPPGFTWNTSCANPTAPDAVSVSLDPNGTNSNLACDWATSGFDAINDPGGITLAPASPGWHNNTTPTAVSLLAINSSNGYQPWPWLLLVGGLGLGTAVIWRKREHITP